MKVYCERDCKKKTGETCTLDKICIKGDGSCLEYQKTGEFEPFREDNVVVFDDSGIPSIMVRFSRVTDEELFGGENKPHPAFIIDGELYDEIYISKYPNCIIEGKAYSLPMSKPATEVTFEEAERACFSKGEGWHLLTAAERGLVALDSLKRGTLPHGNTSCGKYHANKNEEGNCYDGYRTLTGSGPETWTHDHTAFGVADLCGNVWEWCRGLRLMDGKVQIASDNDAAMDIDLTRDSKNWVPLEDGKDEVYINIGDGNLAFGTEPPSCDWDGSRWKDVNFEFGVNDKMRELALFAGEGEAYLYADTDGERLPLCGGGWADGASAGVFALNLPNPRSSSGASIGFRSAYYCKR